MTEMACSSAKKKKKQTKPNNFEMGTKTKGRRRDEFKTKSEDATLPALGKQRQRVGGIAASLQNLKIHTSYFDICHITTYREREAFRAKGYVGLVTAIIARG